MVPKILIALVLISIISISARSQTANDVRIDPKQPSVYFTAERLESDKLWLRLHNNSRWAISFSTESAAPITIPFRLADGRVVMAMIDGTEVSPKYIIENPITGGAAEYWCAIVESWLAPGSSALMSVDLEKLKPISYFLVTFYYEWGGNGPEPEHRAKFEYYPNLQIPTGDAGKPIR